MVGIRRGFLLTSFACGALFAQIEAGGAAGERNLEEAQLWLERAIAQGIPDAESDLAALTQTTQHVPT
jgi:hypothetical protein